MEPLIANSSSNNCGNTIGSNCVPYTGKTIPCINQCNGDSVSDIEYKLGQGLCYTQSLLDMSTLDLTCIYTPCPSCQSPTTLIPIMQILVNTICTQASQISMLQTQVAELIAGTSVH